MLFAFPLSFVSIKERYIFMIESALRFCLFGASPGTGNQGVNALCWSAIEGISERVNAQIHVFHYGGAYAGNVVPGSEPPVHFHSEPMSAGRKIWRDDHLLRAVCAARVNSRRNAIVRAVRQADAVLDASGGDSFTDLYGAARFKSIIAPKRIALTLGCPLILLPQTYGPFESPRNERIASDIVDRAALAYARDLDSYDRLKQLLGSRFDPQRHRLGVDLAFGLRSSKPRDLEPGVQRALAGQGGRPLIVLNVSGLLTNQAMAAKDRFALVADYRALTASIVSALLNSSDAHILLLPHVHAPEGHYESDLDACRALVRTLPERSRDAASNRVTTVTRLYDASELKWIIGQADWLCGTRMHSTIAALSQGIPTSALAYSLKTKGVFETCGVGDAVTDLRYQQTETAKEQVLWTWHNRKFLAETIATKLPGVMAQSRRQLDEIVSSLQLPKAA
jgi:colanic acid/amylovoran biosynthesis protein